jgi:hypothetical protein
MNTTEWSEFRTNGTWNHDPATYPYVSPGAHGGSQEYNVNASVDNPLNKTCNPSTDAAHIKGTRQRAVGTGELVKEVKAIKDALGYTFFSFGNISSIGSSNNYGYLSIDGVDPLFQHYNGTGADPGQPNGAAVVACGAATACNPGTLPTCVPGGQAGPPFIPDCKANAIWAGANSFPTLRNGTYRAWSLLRAICDTANPHCLASSDPMGAQALIAKVQTEIDGNNSVPDFLPYGDAQYVRSHYNLVAGQQHADPFVHFDDLPAVGSLSTVTLDVAGTAVEEGGDAGGCILPVNAASPGSGGQNANDTQILVTKARAHVGANTTYLYSDVSGTSLANLFALTGGPKKVSIWGFTHAQDNGVFTISAVAGGTFTVSNNAGMLETLVGVASPNGSAGNGSAGGSANTQCGQ